MKDYPTYQWSRFSPDGRSEQVVVRGDDAMEMEEQIKIARSWLPKELVKAFPDDEPGKPMAQAHDVGEPKAPMCPVHKKAMRKGKFPGSWYCPTNVNPDKNGEPQWCKAKPVLTEWV